MAEKELDRIELDIRDKTLVCVRRLLVLTALGVTAYVLFGTYTYFSDGEYCTFVSEGESYHLLNYGQPCRLQWRLLWEPILMFLGFLAFVQSPLWILYCLLRRKKSKDATTQVSSSNANVQ